MRNFKKILITGGNSFVGSHLAYTLKNKGITPVCLVRKTSDIKHLKECNADICCAELSNKADLDKALEGIDAVYHIAAAKRAKTRQEYFDINQICTRNLLEACVNSKSIKRFVYVSSIAVTGPSPDGYPMTEETPCKPITYYGESKLAGEKEVQKFMDKLPAVIVRPPAIYGPRDKDIFIFFQIIKKAGIKPVFTGGKKFFNLAYVEDIVKGLLLVIEKEEAIGKTYILCDDNHYTWEHVEDTIADVLKIKAKRILIPQFIMFFLGYLNDGISFITNKPAALNRQKAKELLSKNWLCNPHKIKKELGFTGSFSLKEGVQKTYEWYKDNNWL